MKSGTAKSPINQMRVVVNALIKRYGKPKEIVAELARELKDSRESKALTQKRQAEGAKRNETDDNAIRDAFKIEHPNRSDRLKYRLWKEQTFGELGVGKCMYCGKPLTSDALYSAEVHVDHILPYSRTLLDAQSNKVLCCAACNEIKGNKTPYEAFGNSGKWSGIMERVQCLTDASKRRKFSPDAIAQFDKDSGFVARQLTDNAYLSRMALRYLKSVCPNAWSVNGGMTHLLREKWGIDKILSRKIDDTVIAHFNLDSKKINDYRKNRQDHRHHALDAAVIACIDRSLVKEISTLNAHGSLDRIVPPDMPIKRSVLEKMTRSVVVSFKPEHGAQGKLSKETLLGYRNFTGDNGKTEKKICGA